MRQSPPPLRRRGRLLQPCCAFCSPAGSLGLACRYETRRGRDRERLQAAGQKITLGLRQRGAEEFKQTLPVTLRGGSVVGWTLREGEPVMRAGVDFNFAAFRPLR